MFTLAIIALVAFGILPAVGWVFRVFFHLVGWSLRLMLGVLFLPLIIVFAVLSGLTAIGALIVPIAVVGLVIMLVTSLANTEN